MEVEGISVNAQDENGYSPMHAAASYGEIAIIHFLLSNGADINIRDGDGDTPLLFCETPEVFEVLVAGGADTEATNAAGKGIVDICMEDENEVMVNYFVSKGMQVSGYSITQRDNYLIHASLFLISLALFLIQQRVPDSLYTSYH